MFRRKTNIMIYRVFSRRQDRFRAKCAGKSTLLKIAGLDKEIGNAIPIENLKIGYLPQEPQLDDTLDIKGLNRFRRVFQLLESLMS